jgi:hypothetical protein
VGLKLPNIGRKLSEYGGDVGQFFGGAAQGLGNVANQTQRVVGGAALNVGRGLVDSAVNAGRTVGSLPVTAGKQLYYLGQGDVQGANRAAQQSYIGQHYGSQFAGDTSGLGNAAAFGLDALGLKGGGSLIQQGVKQALPKVALKGAVQGTGLGGAYGLAQSAQQNNLSLPNVARNVGTGAVLGGVAGGAVPVVARAGGPLIKQATPILKDEAGFIGQKRTGGKFAPDKQVHPDDLKTMVDFIDHARSGAKLNPQAAYQLELDASRIAEHYGIGKSGQSLGNLANAFDKHIQGSSGLLGKVKATLNSESGTANLGAELLPKSGVKQVSTLDKLARSTRSIIERQGEHGQKLGGMLQGARDTEELYLAKLQKSLPTVRSLKGKDFENFVEATQGQAQPSSPKVAQAVAEWQTTHPGIRDRAVQAGLDVGDLGPQYYPHFVDFEKVFKDRNAYNEAINHLVQTGQAKTPEEAIKALSYARDISRNRKFGNLEASRLVDIPQYDKTPNSLVSYLQGSARRIAQTETFGAKDEHALKLIAKAGQQGFDTEAMKSAYDVAVGAKRYGQSATNFSNKARQYQSTTRLGLGAITNASQSVNTGIVTGHLRTMGAMLKQLSPKARSYVEDTGVISDGVLNDLRQQTGFVGQGLSKITAPGFNKVETFNRSVAATAGKDYGLRLAQKGDEATLRRLGVTGPIEGRTLTEAQQIQISRKVVEKTQFKVDPQDLPGWADSPGGKLVAQFRTFSYNQGKFFSNEILKPARRGNYLPLGRLLAALPVGYGLYETKRTINRRPEDPSQPRVALESFGNVGGAGLAMDIFRGLVPLNGKYLPPDRRIAMALSTFGGPTAGLAADLVGGTSEALQQKNIPAAGLDGKVAVQSGDKYNDLTPLSRTGLRQVPIVGGALQNTLLPYQSKKPTVALTPGASAAETAPVNTTGLPASGSPLTGDNTTPEAKAAAKLKKDTRKAQLTAGLRLGGTDELDKAQSRIDTATKKFPAQLSSDSQTILTRYAKLNANGRDKFDADPKNTLKLKLAQYEENKLGGKMTKLEDYKAQQGIAKLRVTSNFSTEASQLHGMSKAALKDYFDANPDQKGLFNEVMALDQALTKGGFQTKAKFANGLSSGKSAVNTGGKYKYAVSLNAGGQIARPKVSVRKSAPKATARVATGGAPKVSIKRSMV